MGIRRVKVFDSYRYPYSIPPVLGQHGELSAVVRLSAGRWQWIVSEDGKPFDHGEQLAKEDAIWGAVLNINRLLEERGAAVTSHLVSDPNSWLGEDRDPSLVQQLREMRPKLKPLWKAARRR